MSADTALREMAEETLVLNEKDRKVNGINQARFCWLHLGCEVVPHEETVNSVEIDSATVDPRPALKSWLHCNNHGVDSAVETALLP